MEMDEASCGTHGGTQSLAAVACCPGAPWSALAPANWRRTKKKMANQGRRRSSVQDVSGCACGYVRLRPGRVERGGRLLRPSHPGTRGRRPTVSGMSICAGVGRMKGDERGNGQPADGGSSHLGTRGRRLAACGRRASARRRCGLS